MEESFKFFMDQHSTTLLMWILSRSIPSFASIIISQLKNTPILLSSVYSTTHQYASPEATTIE